MGVTRVLVTGRGLVEAPRWHEDRLVFSGWTAGEVLAYDPVSRSLGVVARASSLPLCTDWLPDGRLVVVTSPPGALLVGAPGDPTRSRRSLTSPRWPRASGTMSWRMAKATSS
ncbi:MAG: hypothetical protein R3C32_00855 [Chloroflexota bacterium]